MVSTRYPDDSNQHHRHRFCGPERSIVLSMKKCGEGPVTLLGDAIHPTTPNLGQGGCMAIEDAMVLARCLHQNTTSSTDALRTYEQLRYKVTTAVSNYSKNLRRAIGQWENVFARGIRRSVLSLIPESLAQRLVKIVFDYNACEVEISKPRSDCCPPIRCRFDPG